MPDSAPLSDLRVLDLSRGIAGAFCTELSTQVAADVVTLEPLSGHPLRRNGPVAADRPHRETGAMWLYLGAGKRSATLDIAARTGQSLFQRMVEEANLIVEDYPPGKIDELGLGFDALRRIVRRIVLLSVMPFGQDGPCAGWKATNLTSFASGGQMSLTGDPDREPLVAGGQQAEYQAGLQAFAAAAVAAFNADALEVPQHIDISAQECMASALELYLPWWAYLKRDISKRRGNVLSAMVGVFPAKEGHIGLHIMPRNWPRFAKAISRPELVEDVRFKDARSRLQNNDELEAIVYEWASREDPREAYQTAGAVRAPIAFVHTIQDLFESEQLRSRDVYQRVAHPEAGEITLPGPPFRMSEVERPARASLLGEHNEELYCDEMGLSRRDLARLRAARVV